MKIPFSLSPRHHWQKLKLKAVYEPSTYYFFHIPKTAGTSLRVLIERQFTPAEVCPAYSIVPLLKLSDAELKSFRLFRGHLYNMLFHLTPWPLKTFTLLRDPIERSLSHWDHIRRIPSHYFHERSHRHGSLQAFLEDPETRPMIANFQARSLVLDADPRRLASRYDIPQLEAHALDRDFESQMLPEMAPAELLKHAARKLESFAFVGLTERFDQSVRIMCDKFGWELESSSSRENVSPSRDRRAGLSARELSLLHDLTAVDRQLYSYVENRLASQRQATRQKAG